MISNNRDQSNESNHKSRDTTNAIGENSGLIEDTKIDDAEEPQREENSKKGNQWEFVEWNCEMSVLEL